MLNSWRFSLRAVTRKMVSEPEKILLDSQSVRCEVRVGGRWTQPLYVPAKRRWLQGGSAPFFDFFYRKRCSYFCTDHHNSHPFYQEVHPPPLVQIEVVCVWCFSVLGSNSLENKNRKIHVKATKQLKFLKILTTKQHVRTKLELTSAISGPDLVQRSRHNERADFVWQRTRTRNRIGKKSCCVFTCLLWVRCLTHFSNAKSFGTLRNWAVS